MFCHSLTWVDELSEKEHGIGDLLVNDEQERTIGNECSRLDHDKCPIMSERERKKKHKNIRKYK